MWLHPCCSRTIGDIAEIGELLTDPVSALVVRVPLTRISQEPSAPTASVLIQQQLPYLKSKREIYFTSMQASVYMIEKCNNSRSFKICYSSSTICVGSLSWWWILCCAEISAVVLHGSYCWSYTATTSTYKRSRTNECLSSNCSLGAGATLRRWSSPSNTMCYLNLQSEKW